jgi:glucokinase
VGTADGQTLGEALIPTPAAQGAERVVEAMVMAARQALASAEVDVATLRGAGIAAAGAIDQERGVVVHSPHLTGWDHVPLVSMIRQHLDVPTAIANDANVAALGEHRYGAGRGVSNLLFITVSTGIGGGIIINGQLYNGSLGLAGEVGHISVLTGGPYGRSRTAGALESLASGTALANEARRRLEAGERSVLEARVRSHGAEAVTAEILFDALGQGDEMARQIVAWGIQYLGAGLTSLVNVLNPGMLIIGGGLSNEWESYIQPAVEIMREEAFAGMGRDLPVVPPQLGANAGALGAVALAADQVPPAGQH